MDRMIDTEVLKRVQSFSWEPWLERHFSPFLLSLFRDGITRKTFEKIGVSDVEMDAFVYENSIWYQSKSVFDRMEVLLEKYLQGHSIFDITKSLEKFRVEKKKRLKELALENGDVLRKLEEARDIFSSSTAYIWLAHGLEHLYDKKLREVVPQHIRGDVNLFIGDASFPSKKNTHALMEEAIARGDDPQEIADKFGWLKVRDGFSEPFTVEDIIKQKEEQKGHRKENAKTVDIPQPLQQIFSEIRELVFFRTERTDVFYELLFVARPIFREVGEKLGISFQELKNYPIQSILEEKPKKYPPLFTYIVYKGNGVFLTESLFGKANTMGNTEIKGTIAQKGCVKGIVKIVRKTSEVDKVERGDILVTQMTFPAFIQAMHRASAFVTDEGGITCHAAIVARELKKPCIIGTKIATKVLKDGDLVEVDADHGVVRTIQDEKDAAKKSETELLYAGHTWFMTITRNMSFWHQCLSDEGHFHHTRDFGVDAKLQVLHITSGGTETSLFRYDPNYSEYAEAVLKKVSTEDGIVDLKRRYHTYAKKLLSVLSNAKVDLSVDTLRDFLDEYRRFSAGLMITATLGRSGADRLTEKLKALGYTEEEIPEMNSLITYPKEHTPLFNSQLDLLKIGIAVQDGLLKGASQGDALSQWLLEHGHIPVNFCEDPWGLDDARKQLGVLLQKDCKKEHTKAEKNHKQRTEKGGRLLEKIGDREVLILAHAIAEGTYLNEFRKNIFSSVSLEYRDIFGEIARKAGAKNWRSCFYLTPVEMLDILSGVEVDVDSILRERSVAGTYVDTAGVFCFLDNDTIDRFYSYIAKIHGSSVENTDVSSIKGSSANRGKATGIARLILSSKDFDKLNPGEILVTTMTSVDFVPVMGRAAAFVTNEGGITSHASIVAREMNKPCIIGTKIATQVLKDGMFIEVDANEGVVRILEA